MPSYWASITIVVTWIRFQHASSPTLLSLFPGPSTRVPQRIRVPAYWSTIGIVKTPHPHSQPLPGFCDVVGCRRSGPSSTARRYGRLGPHQHDSGSAKCDQPTAWLAHRQHADRHLVRRVCEVKSCPGLQRRSHPYVAPARTKDDHPYAARVVDRLFFVPVYLRPLSRTKYVGTVWRLQTMRRLYCDARAVRGRFRLVSYTRDLHITYSHVRYVCRQRRCPPQSFSNYGNFSQLEDAQDIRDASGTLRTLHSHQPEDTNRPLAS